MKWITILTVMLHHNKTISESYLTLVYEAVLQAWNAEVTKQFRPGKKNRITSTSFAMGRSRCTPRFVLYRCVPIAFRSSASISPRSDVDNTWLTDDRGFYCVFTRAQEAVISRVPFPSRHDAQVTLALTLSPGGGCYPSVGYQMFCKLQLVHYREQVLIPIELSWSCFITQLKLAHWHGTSR